LTKQVQNLSTGNRGNRGYNNSGDFRNTSQSTAYTPNRQNRVVCYSCQSGHIVRNCPNAPPINNTSNSNTTVPQPANDSGQQLAQIQQMLAQLLPQDNTSDQSLN
ncbi:hypothetical protein RhiirB3_440061, partial [Rhizophagus irregularis]